MTSLKSVCVAGYWAGRKREFYNFVVRFSVYCLAFCFEFEVKITKTKAVKNICMQEIFILLLTFNPG